MDKIEKFRELLFVSRKKKRRIKPTFLMSGLSMIGEAREFEKKICFDDIVFQAEFQSTSHRLTRIKNECCLLPTNENELQIRHLNKYNYE